MYPTNKQISYHLYGLWKRFPTTKEIMHYQQTSQALKIERGKNNLS